MPRKRGDRFSEEGVLRKLSLSAGPIDIRNIIYNIGKNPKPRVETDPKEPSLSEKLRTLLVKKLTFKEICTLLKEDPDFSKVNAGSISKALSSMDGIQKEKAPDGTVLFSLNN